MDKWIMGEDEYFNLFGLPIGSQLGLLSKSSMTKHNTKAHSLPPAMTPSPTQMAQGPFDNK